MYGVIDSQMAFPSKAATANKAALIQRQLKAGSVTLSRKYAPKKG